MYIISLFFLLFCIQIIKTDLYIDSTINYAKYEDFTRVTTARYIGIGNMKGLDLQVVDEIGVLTTKEIWHGWHGASLGQVPPTSTTSSYFSYSEIQKNKFKIKSNDISQTEIKVFLQSIDGNNFIDCP